MIDGTATLTTVADKIIDTAPNRPDRVTDQRRNSLMEWGSMGAAATLLVNVDLDFDHHPGAQQAVLLVNGDAHRQTLGDLGEVAAWVRAG